jgi:hypothetical protein
MNNDNKNLGKWKMKDSNGSLKVYHKDQIISRDGNEYVALRKTSGFSPEHGERGGWKKTTTNRAKQFTESTQSPSNPKPGDEWLNLSSGILYKYLDDGNSKQWVSFT